MNKDESNNTIKTIKTIMNEGVPLPAKASMCREMTDGKSYEVIIVDKDVLRIELSNHRTIQCHFFNTDDLMSFVRMFHDDDVRNEDPNKRRRVNDRDTDEETNRSHSTEEGLSTFIAECEKAVTSTHEYTPGIPIKF